MNTRSCIVAALLSILTLGFFTPGAHRAVAQNPWNGALAIVVGPGFGERDISFAMLRRAFRGEATEFGGSRLVPFNYAPEHPARRALDLSVLGMPPDQVGAYWIDRRIRGEGMPPRIVPSPLIMKAVVARLPGAIGYLPADQVDANLTVLTIDGKHVRSPDYPLRLR